MMEKSYKITATATQSARPIPMPTRANRQDTQQRSAIYRLASQSHGRGMVTASPPINTLTLV